LSADARPIFELTASDERELRRNLTRWSRRFLGLPDQEFDDAYQGAWRRLRETERRGTRTRNLEHALRWNIQNCWLAECRRRRRRPTVALEDCADDTLLHRAAPDPAEEFERLEAARYLLRALRDMSERRAQVLILRNVWGLTPAEVCDELGISHHAYREEHAAALKAIFARLAHLLEDSESVEDRCPDSRAA
jgi:RNA polymerase sigma factor (sigma-70 family)